MKKEEAKLASKAGEWSTEDMQNLTKACLKFPVGTVNRWKIIADFIGTKTSKEVIAKAQEIAAKRSQKHEQQKEKNAVAPKVA